MDNTSDKYVLPWLKVVKDIAPRQVMIYTIDRETPDQDLQKATHEELDRIVALLTKEGLSDICFLLRIILKRIIYKKDWI